MTGTNPYKLHSVKEAASLLGVSLKTMWRLIDSRQISFIKIKRRILISTQAIEEFISAHTVARMDPKAVAHDIIYR
jgi:excisionase family DNA binding protein